MFKHIKKLAFLTVISSSLFLLGACKDEQRSVVKWNLQSQASATSIDFIELKAFSENVKTMSAGRLIITPHSGGIITNGPDIYDAVSEGRIEMGNGWPNWWSGQNPAWAVMNAGPFDFMNLDSSMMFFLAGNGTQLANEMAQPQNIIWRPAWWPGMEFGLLSREPITGLADLQDKKVRIGPGLPSEVLSEASDAYTIPLVPQEILPALENGDIDAVEWTTAGGVLDLNVHKVAPYAMVPAIWQPSVVSDFLINQDAYNQLSPDLQAILETAIKAYTLTTTFKAKHADFSALKQLVDSGVTLTRWSPDDIVRWRSANDKIIANYKKDPYTKKVLDAKKAYKDDFRAYYQHFKRYD
jgi:TRAP-type mannitol/chloroaromatic compound transport system substrate-binding protein